MTVREEVTRAIWGPCEDCIDGAASCDVNFFRWTKVTDMLTKFTHSFRWTICLFWIVVSVYCVRHVVPSVLTHTTSVYDYAGKTSPSQQAFETYQHYFPTSAQSHDNVIFIARTDGGPPFASEDLITKHMQCQLAWKLGCRLCAGSALETRKEGTENCPYQILSHWSLDYTTHPMPMSKTNPVFPYLPHFANRLVADTYMAMVVRAENENLQANVTTGKILHNFATNIMHEIDVAAVADFRKFNIIADATGFDVNHYLSQTALQHDLYYLSLFLLCTAVVAFTLSLRNYRFVFFASMCTFISLSCMLGVSNLTSKFFDVPTIALPITLVVMVAVGIYYGLVFFTILQTEVDSGVNHHEHISNVDNPEYTTLLNMVPTSGTQVEYTESQNEFNAYYNVVNTLHLSSRIFCTHFIGLMLALTSLCMFQIYWLALTVTMLCIGVMMVNMVYVTFLPALYFTNYRMIIGDDCFSRPFKNLRFMSKSGILSCTNIVGNKCFIWVSMIAFVTILALSIYAQSMVVPNRAGNVMLPTKNFVMTHPFAKGTTDPYKLVFVPQGSPPCLVGEVEKCQVVSELETLHSHFQRFEPSTSQVCRCDSPAVWSDGFWSESQDLLEGVVEEFGWEGSQKTWTSTQAPNIDMKSVMYSWPIAGVSGNSRAPTARTSFNLIHNPLPVFNLTRGQIPPTELQEARFSHYASNYLMSHVDVQNGSGTRTTKSAVLVDMVVNHDSNSERATTFAEKFRNLIINKLQWTSVGDGSYCGQYSCMSISGGGIRMLDISELITTKISAFLVHLAVVLLIFGVVAYNISFVAVVRAILSTTVTYMIAQSGCMLLWQYGLITSDGVSVFQNLLGVGLIFALILTFDLMHIQYRDYNTSREATHDNKAEFALGLSLQASLIMAICFSGLGMTSIPFLHQLGVLLVSAILTDALFRLTDTIFIYRQGSRKLKR